MHGPEAVGDTSFEPGTSSGYTQARCHNQGPEEDSTCQDTHSHTAAFSLAALTCIMSGSSLTAAMMVRQAASISRKALPSTGICFMISSAPKMGSRYSHLPWHLSHSSRIS